MKSASPYAVSVYVSVLFVWDGIVGLYVRVTYSVDQDGDLLQNAGDEAVEGLHPIALEKEVAVDVKVAAIVAGDLGA